MWLLLLYLPKCNAWDEFLSCSLLYRRAEGFGYMDSAVDIDTVCVVCNAFFCLLHPLPVSAKLLYLFTTNHQTYRVLNQRKAAHSSIRSFTQQQRNDEHERNILRCAIVSMYVGLIAVTISMC